MRIDFEAKEKRDIPLWDLTVGYCGRVYPVSVPNLEQLTQLLLTRHQNESEALECLPGLFAELTGISDRIAPENLFRFFTGLMVYIDQCVHESTGSGDADCLDLSNTN